MTSLNGVTRRMPFKPSFGAKIVRRSCESRSAKSWSSKSAPRLQNSYPITFLGEAQRRDAAAESGSDDQVVVVVCIAHHLLRSAWELFAVRYSPESGSRW